MTLLVRDEIDIVRQNIEFHLALGVDHIIATDNGSVDGTREVLSEFARQGVLTLIDEPGRDYAQGKWVTRMALMARESFGADWVMNNDADEFWLPPPGGLKQELALSDADMLLCARRNMFYAHDEEDGSPWFRRLIHTNVSRERVPFKPPDMLRDPLPQPVCCFVPGRKCLLRTAHLTAVGEGNHEGTFEREAVRRNSTIGIYHFPVRSAAQFERKVRRGGEALSRDTERPAGMAWHWRRWHYKLAQEGFGATIADALPSARQIEQGRLEGRFEEVTIIRDLILEPAGLARYA